MQWVRWRYLVFYLVGGLVAMLAQVLADPHSTVPNLGASGAIAAVMGAFMVTYPRDRIRTVLFIFVFVRIKFIPAALLIGFWFLTQLFNAGSVAHVQSWRGGVLGAHWWLYLRGRHCAFVRRPGSKFRTRKLARMGAHVTFNDNSCHFCTDESKRHHRPLSHIQHQWRTKAGDANAIVMPHARIHDPC